MMSVFSCGVNFRKHLRLEKKGKTLDNGHTRALLWFLSTFIQSFITLFFFLFTWGAILRQLG